jgi:hypothetical protein
VREHRDRIGNRVHGVSDVLERGAEDGPHSRRIWFLVRDFEVKWLAAKDTSVLLWVLALLLLGWALTFLLLLLLLL